MTAVRAKQKRRTIDIYSFAPIRENKSLNCDQDLAEYLKKVLEVRTNLRINR